MQMKSSPALKTSLTVVGIGASAGGLDPCRRFFAQMPGESGLAFVLIQHLAPEHKSETESLLGRCTPMPVVEASQGVRVEPNHVYVIPPNGALAIRHGRLRLSEPAEMRVLHEQFKRGEKPTASMESQRLIKDGRIIDVWLTLTLLRDEQGKPIGIATTKRDITQRKRDQAIIAVEDHGVGFDPKVVHDPHRSNGLGLFSIRERLDYLGGSVEIQSGAGKKTTVTLTMPIVSEQPPGAETRP